MDVKRGDALADGVINPHDLLKYKGLRPTQRYISDELYKMYRGQGVDRRAVEMITRSMTNTARVEDPGDVSGFVRGDLVPYNSIKKLNSSVTSGKKLKAKPVLKGVNEMPLYKMEDWLARMNHNRLQSTVQEAALQGWSSYLGDKHPIPSLIEGKSFGRSKFY
jgi:DNA-directed RNA polymerase subunit beta'